MADKNKFTAAVNEGYSFKGDSIVLGGAMVDGECLANTFVRAPLKTFNRHGLIAGATGSGKTKTLQTIAESLSSKGVPTLMMDIKGDLSGLALPGTDNPKIADRHSKIGVPWKPVQFPVEFLSLSKEKGARLRATVSEFGPVLFSRILDLNDTQGGVVALVFKYCDDKKIPLLDLKDFKKSLQYLTNEGKEEIKNEYGVIATSTSSTILRKIIEIEQQGAEEFFGETSFEVEDLLRIDDNGYGMMHIVRLADMQDKPKLFSTFMMSLLAEVYSTFPEVGDADAPKLVIFIDEAHLIFKEATKALLSQIETIIKLIRSKGVGIIFITQTPVDIPASVLGQLGLKVQHAFRAFTAQDRKDIKQVAENYPESAFYKTEDLLTQLGIGEALITALSEKGTPTPLVHTLLCAPQSRMDILSLQELEENISKSKMAAKYNQHIDRESAFEILNKKLQEHAQAQQEGKPAGKEAPSVLEQVTDSTVGRQVMRTVAREMTRGLLGVLGLGSTRTRKKSSGWF